MRLFRGRGRTEEKVASWKSRKKDGRKDGEQCYILQRYRKMKTEKGKG